MKVLIESMTRFKVDGLQIRCWRQEPDEFLEYDEPLTHQDVAKQTEKIFSKSDGWTYPQIAREILKIDRMNAVEVIGDDGDGVVLYKDWP